MGNEPDGTVRAHVEGSADAVEQVLRFVRSGPPDAAVDTVDVREVAPAGTTTFEIR